METAAKRHGSFEDPEAYKADREFRKKVCAVAKKSPESEKFVLNPQMRKAALSVTNDIAEGRGGFPYVGNIRFMLIARGSVEELPDDLNTCEDEACLSPSAVAKLNGEGYSLMRLINGYIRHRRDSKPARASACAKTAPPTARPATTISHGSTPS